MNIKPLGIKVYQNNLVGAKETKKAEGLSKKSHGDSISISREGMEKRGVKEVSARLAGEIAAPADNARLTELREQIKKGEYAPDEKMLLTNILKGVRI
ncbi:MAG: flagellar biosynthesis anti-sigma factor FlgM [Oscillospiraceae bacterium]